MENFFFGLKICVPKECGPKVKVKKHLCPKKFGVQKSLGEKNEGTKNLVQKIFGSKEIW